VQPILLLLIGIAPGLIWLAVFFLIFRKQTSDRPKTIFTVFLWGALITLPALLIEVASESIFGIQDNANVAAFIVASVFLIAPIEELLKFIILRRAIFNTEKFTRSHDGMLLGMALGLGFGTVENTLLALQSESPGLILTRALTATLLHAVTAGIIGFYLGLAFHDKKKVGILSFQGILLASLFHGIYNLVVTLDISVSLLLTSGLLIVSYLFLGIGSQELTKIDREVEKEPQTLYTKDEN
jgi:RsiW-degrading membrane proteinase PrsW (M82 family)